MDTTRTPMTGQQRLVVRAFRYVVFQSGSFAHRFAKSMVQIEAGPEPTLTEKQIETLWQVAYQYRRQLTPQAKDAIPLKYHAAK